MIQLWAAGCYSCMAFSLITAKRDDARWWKRKHDGICRKARVFRVVLAATR